MSDTLTHVMPSATPTDEEIAAWNELPRDEQLARMRQILTRPDATADSGFTADQLLAEAHRRSGATVINRTIFFTSKLGTTF